MSEIVTPSEGTLETCRSDYIINDFAFLKVIFLGRRGAGDLLRLSTVTNLTVFTPVFSVWRPLLAFLLTGARLQIFAAGAARPSRAEVRAPPAGAI